MEEVYLPPQSQERLLRVSRRTLEDFVRGRGRQADEIDDPLLQRGHYGAFVSLHKKQELRGCIGNCAPKTPLYETVIEMTEAAASRDRRVAPIRREELDAIHIEITVLSPLELIDDPLNLEVGKHGLYIARGGMRGVLLPQVATQYNWDLKAFLEQTCLKAGLRKNSWQEPDTKVSSFTALIIEEQP